MKKIELKKLIDTILNKKRISDLDSFEKLELILNLEKKLKFKFDDNDLFETDINDIEIIISLIQKNDKYK